METHQAAATETRPLKETSTKAHSTLQTTQSVCTARHRALQSIANPSAHTHRCTFPACLHHDSRLAYIASATPSPQWPLPHRSLLDNDSTTDSALRTAPPLKHTRIRKFCCFTAVRRQHTASPCVIARGAAGPLFSSPPSSSSSSRQRHWSAKICKTTAAGRRPRARCMQRGASGRHIATTGPHFTMLDAAVTTPKKTKHDVIWRSWYHGAKVV